MRIRWLVTYDVADPRRLRKVYRLLRGYGDWMQLSVFRCDLNERERLLLERRLEDLIHPGEDQVLFVRAGPVEGRGEDSFTTLGKPLKAKPRLLIF